MYPDISRKVEMREMFWIEILILIGMWIQVCKLYVTQCFICIFINFYVLSVFTFLFHRELSVCDAGSGCQK